MPRSLGKHVDGWKGEGQRSTSSKGWRGSFLHVASRVHCPSDTCTTQLRYAGENTGGKRSKSGGKQAPSDVLPIEQLKLLGGYHHAAEKK